MEDNNNKYPYFPLPDILWLKEGKISGTEREKLLQHVAVNSPDRLALADLVGEDAALFANFYPPEEEARQPDTDSTIDTFLDTYGNASQKEIATLERLIFNPTPDYASVLAAEAAAAGDNPPQTGGEQDALINKFIEQSQRAAGHFPTTVVERPEPHIAETVDTTPVQTPEEAENGSLSESLAQIYIRQHKYSKALEIISAISLNFPEKSIYFADQIRFLRKLVLNENKINKK